MPTKHRIFIKALGGIVFCLILVTLIMCCNTGTNAGKYAYDIKICVDGKMVAFTDQKPCIDTNNRTLIPVRFPAEELGASVEWLKSTGQIKIVNKNHTTLPDSNIILTVGKQEVTVNGMTLTMDTTAVIMGNRLMVPLSFISEYMGARIKWDSGSRTAFVFTRNQSATEIKLIMAIKAGVNPIKVDKTANINILTYHEVNTPPTSAALKQLYIEPATFQQHLDYLKQNGYNTITLRELSQHWDYGKPLPTNPIILTFDDGYRSMYDFVMPELMKRDMVATFFVITDKFNNPLYVNASMIREMHSNGMEIASHSHSHGDLRTADLEMELSQSKTLLESLINDTVYSFCYPYGLYNKNTINKLAKCGYKIAVTTKLGEASVNQNIYELKRISINRDDRIENLIKK